jgi:hypothetical protein
MTVRDPASRAAALTRTINALLPGWEFAVETFPRTEIFNPGGAQAFFQRGPVYEHAEGSTPEDAALLAALRILKRLE